MSRENDRNLLDETENIITSNGKSVDDVLWVGDANGWCDWKTFVSLADFTYDSGFGGEEVATSLMVVGSDWWLERHEYDGSEWWEFKTLPQAPLNKRTPLTMRRTDESETWGGVHWA